MNPSRLKNPASKRRQVAVPLLLLLLGSMLILNRYFPYLLHGPFGFGYDTGIYKKSFEEIISFPDIFSSQISLLPSLLGYIGNSLSIPPSLLLYHAYVFFSAAVAVPLYLLTKEYFGKREAAVAVALFSVSYVQVFASEFYLYKAMLGAIFLLYSFYFFAKKSKWFYLSAALLALTQLPQLLILLVAISITAILTWKEHKKFYLQSLVLFAGVFLVLLISSPNHLLAAANVIWLSISGVQTHDFHLAGLFMPVDLFLRRAIFILIGGTLGLILAFKKRNHKALPLQIAVAFLAIVIFFKLFFQNRFVVDLDLLLMPFVAYFAVSIFDSVFWKKRLFDYVAAILLLAITAFLHFQYYTTTTPKLTAHEIWAIDEISKKSDAEYVMVTDTTYAPWVYGFANKKTLAPGIFESVWTYEQWQMFHSTTIEQKLSMLNDIARKYGKYYLFMGTKQNNYDLTGPTTKKIFEVGGATIYEVTPVPYPG